VTRTHVGPSHSTVIEVLFRGERVEGIVAGCPAIYAPEGINMATTSPRKVLRRLAVGVFTGVLAASLSVVLAVLDETPAAACSNTLRTPYKLTSNVVATSISNGNCDIRGFSLNRHRWYGWQEVAHKRINRNSSTHITWNCNGVGTYNYRAQYQWAFHGHRGPQARLSC
jgi:hypothetical protein